MFAIGFVLFMIGVILIPVFDVPFWERKTWHELGTITVLTLLLIGVILMTCSIAILSWKYLP